MKYARKTRILPFIALGALWFHSAPDLLAQKALFIGNSYTYGGPEMTITNHGGIPKLVEAIAASKGKKFSTTMLTVGGKDLAYHLQQPKTDVDLKADPWDFVVLQDFSTEATHVGGKLEDFFKDGETFYKRIRAESPQAMIVLYETWARPKQSPFYTGTSTPATFIDPAQMDTEIQKNYGELYNRLKAIEPGTHVELAPVGLAYERCEEKYPGINLSNPDLHHASIEGNYLSALVIYATIFHDSPKGATREFFDTSLDAGVAAKLQ